MKNNHLIDYYASELIDARTSLLNARMLNIDNKVINQLEYEFNNMAKYFKSDKNYKRFISDSIVKLKSQHSPFSRIYADFDYRFIWDLFSGEFDFVNDFSAKNIYEILLKASRSAKNKTKDISKISLCLEHKDYHSFSGFTRLSLNQLSDIIYSYVLTKCNVDMHKSRPNLLGKGELVRYVFYFVLNNLKGLELDRGVEIALKMALIKKLSPMLKQLLKFKIYYRQNYKGNKDSDIVSFKIEKLNQLLMNIDMILKLTEKLGNISLSEIQKMYENSDQEFLIELVDKIIIDNFEFNNELKLEK